MKNVHDNPRNRDYLSDPSILKENSKKNFIRENIKHLKQLEKKNKREKKKSESENEIPSFHPRRPLERSKSQARFGRRRLVESKSSKSIVKAPSKSPLTQVELSKASSSKAGRSSKASKHTAHTAAGAQNKTGGGDLSLSDSDTEIIKRSYAGEQTSKRERVLQTPQTQVVEQTRPPFSPFNIDDIKREMKTVQDVDYVKLNQLVQYKPKKYAGRQKSDPTKAPPTYQKGVLPKYLREQKKDSDFVEEKVEPVKEREHQIPVYQNYQNITTNPNQVQSAGGQGQNNKKPAKVVLTQPPPGHILISEAERKQQLNELRKHYAELINKLYRAPARTDSKAKQIKSELESELENLEAAISLFSKEKLFVKIV